MLNDIDVNFWEAVSEVKINTICERELKKKNEKTWKRIKTGEEDNSEGQKNRLEEITNERIPFALCTLYIF